MDDGELYEVPGAKPPEGNTPRLLVGTPGGGDGEGQGDGGVRPRLAPGDTVGRQSQGYIRHTIPGIE